MAVGAALLSGCSFLEEKSWEEVIPKTVDDFSELLVGSAYPSTTTEISNFTSLLDDDITFIYSDLPGEISEGVVASINALAPIFTWQPSVGRDTGAFATIYYFYYEKIMGCNAILDLIDDAVGSATDRDRVKAEALALRAFYYFMLVNFYGEPFGHNPQAPGVPLKLDAKIDAAYPSRNTVEQVYGRITTDITDAVKLMEPLPVVRGDHRFNLPAMRILLCRIYLHMGNWQGVIDQANALEVEGGKLTDQTSWGAVSNTTRYYLRYGSNKEVEWSFGTLPYTSEPANKDLWYTFGPTSGDLFDQIFGENMQSQSGAQYDTRFIYGFEGTFCTKFPTLVATDDGEPKQNFRTAEAIISRAEAYAQNDELGKALADYNTLRKNRIKNYVDESITDKDELIAAIRAERRREFYFEGFRWFDLRRYGMPRIEHKFANVPGVVVTYVLEEDDPMYTLPLEDVILERNANMVQNPSGSAPDRMPIN